MAKVVRGVDSYKKEFLSIFNSLCGRHGRCQGCRAYGVALHRG